MEDELRLLRQAHEEQGRHILSERLVAADRIRVLELRAEEHEREAAAARREAAVAHEDARRHVEAARGERDASGATTRGLSADPDVSSRDAGAPALVTRRGPLAVTRAAPRAGRRRLSAIVTYAESPVPTDDAIAALAQHTPAAVDTRIITLGEANAALGQAGDGLVCLLDAQVRAQPGWFEPLLEVLDAPGGRSEVVAATPCVVDGDGRVLEAGTMVALDGAWYRSAPGSRRTTPVCASLDQWTVHRDSWCSSRKRSCASGGSTRRSRRFPRVRWISASNLPKSVEPSGTSRRRRVTWVPASLAVGDAQPVEAERATVARRAPRCA